MEKLIFGATDGIRGEVGKKPLRPNMMHNLGRAIAKHFKGGLALLGHDTRESGEWMRECVIDGLKECGAEVEDLEILPTPAVQKIVAARDDVSCGIMLTASHNPATDNGVKVFAADGDKLPDEEELEIEAEFFKDELDDDVDVSKVDFRLITREDAIDAYSKMVDDELKLGDSLAGRKIVLDTASGAGYEFSRAVLEGFGLDIEQIDPEPDGKNINDGFGATSPEKMAAKTKKRGVMGVALDGDADRIVVADEEGRLWDGDRINILLTTYLREKKQLPNNTVVVTEYSNYATVKHLEKMGVKVEKVVVGDRFVAQKMRELGANLGSELAGHIIYRPWFEASDGTFMTLFILKIMQEKGKRLADLWADYEYMPSKQWGIKVSEKRPLDEVDGFNEAVKKAEDEFAGMGRVFCRYSGTENKLRILVEGEDVDLVEKHGEILVKIIEKEIGA
ncbi:MAG: hypothetical protein K5837_04240 [Candidatus Saccharibacteria bacterium]|nr:hypothetical protein [Candidatus Saccharibacteria bacterium]